jgi:hypothetical protein
MLVRDRHTSLANDTSGRHDSRDAPELPRILKVNLSQCKHYRDCRDNDDKGHECQISFADLFFALGVSRFMLIRHCSLPFACQAQRYRQLTLAIVH